MRKKFKPRQWVVENLISSGLTILSGAPKIGKSWLLFALAETASTGGNFLDHYKVNKTPTLHLPLEDTECSIKERREILVKKQEGEFIGNGNLYIATEWETGLSGLESYLREHNEIKLVIIDTLGRFMPDIENMNDYTSAVKAISGIKKIADSLDIAILVVRHAKKGSSKRIGKSDWINQSLGSQGIVGAANTIILLQRDIESETGNRKNTGKLNITGRNIKDVSHHVEYSPDFGMWRITEKPKKDKSSGQHKKESNWEDVEV
jgi:RecA-family ATPase